MQVLITLGQISTVAGAISRTYIYIGDDEDGVD